MLYPAGPVHADSTQATLPLPPQGVQLAENPWDYPLPGQPTGEACIFKPPLVLYNSRSAPGKFPEGR